MSVFPVFYRRNGFGVSSPLNAKVTVMNYSRAAMGGPKEATIQAIGDPVVLTTFAEMAGYGVTIFNDLGQPVWWGRVVAPVVDTGTATAEIKCEGWWRTLDNRYYANGTGLLAYPDTSGDRQNFGEGSGIVSGAGSFSAAGLSWTASVIGVWLGKQGAPVDDILIEVRNDSGGNPGATVLATATVAAIDLSLDGMNYVQRPLSSSITVDGTTKWIRISRVGAVDITNYYQIGVNRDAGFAGGTFKHEQPAATWVTGVNIGGTTTTADMNFKLIGYVPTMTQVANALATHSDFLLAVDVINTSGVSTIPYRDGKAKVQKVIEDLLQIGDTTGTRLLAEVTVDRRVRIYTEPNADTPHIILGAMRYGVDVSDMANKVSVIYTTLDGNGSTAGQSFETAWISDVSSIAEYGTHELKFSASDLDAATSVTLATTLLNSHKNPPPHVELSDAVESRLYGPRSNPLRKDTCPAGVWMRVRDVTGYLPPKFVDATLIFVEEASYDAITDRYTPTPRGKRGPFEVTQIKNK